MRKPAAGHETPARRARVPGALGVVARTAAVMGVLEAAIMAVLPHVPLPAALEAAVDPALLTLLGAPGVYVFAVRPLFAELDRLHGARERESTRRDVEGRLRQAFDLAADEDEIVDVSRHAVTLLAPRHRPALLLVDSSRAHLHPAWEEPVTTPDADGEAGGPGCGVRRPDHCPAFALSREFVFEDPQAIDTCRFVRRRADTAPTACLPVTATGRPIGVLHLRAEHAAGSPAFTDDELAGLRLVARQSGQNIGGRRAVQQSLVQASTDPLTGLLNRRAVQDRARAVCAAGPGYAAILLDLDHFKQLNDVHGHDAGDHAVRTTARILQDSVRSDTLVARYGGEEFLLVVPSATEREGLIVAERVRTALARAAATSKGHLTTASLGVAGVPEGTPLAEAVRIADRALLDAKRAGRNRVHAAGSEHPAPPPDDLVEAVGHPDAEDAPAH